MTTNSSKILRTTVTAGPFRYSRSAFTCNSDRILDQDTQLVFSPLPGDLGWWHPIQFLYERPIRGVYRNPLRRFESRSLVSGEKWPTRHPLPRQLGLVQLCLKRPESALGSGLPNRPKGLPLIQASMGLDRELSSCRSTCAFSARLDRSVANVAGPRCGLLRTT